MATGQYWLSLLTGKNWKQFMESDCAHANFKLSRWPIVQKIKPRDTVLCYLTGLSRIVALLEVTGEPVVENMDSNVTDGLQWDFQRRAALRAQFPFPCKVPIRPVVMLTPETAVPIKMLMEEMASDGNWVARSLNALVSNSPNKWTRIEGRITAEALRRASESPVIRPFDPAKLEYESKK